MTKTAKTYSYDGSKSVVIGGQRVTSVYVYEAPVRLWHWVTVIATVVLCASGYFIGRPLPSLSGQASSHFLMGYIRFAHFLCGYLLIAGLLFRIYWGFVGNRFSREIFYVPVWDAQWWREFFFELRWYLFIERFPKKYVGHNPVGQVAMFLFFIAAIVQCFLGFALYGEGLGQGSWASSGFGWVITWVAGGSSLAVHSWHRLLMWAIVLFIFVHVYAAIREDIMSKQSMISTMVSGFRMFKN